MKSHEDVAPTADADRLRTWVLDFSAGQPGTPGHIVATTQLARLYAEQGDEWTRLVQMMGHAKATTLAHRARSLMQQWKYALAFESIRRGWARLNSAVPALSPLATARASLALTERALKILEGSAEASRGVDGPLEPEAAEALFAALPKTVETMRSELPFLRCTLMSELGQQQRRLPWWQWRRRQALQAETTVLSGKMMSRNLR